MGVAKIHKQTILTSRRSQKISIECQYLGSVYEGFKRRSIVQPHTPYLYGGRARYATRSFSTMTGHVFSPYQKLRTCPFLFFSRAATSSTTCCSPCRVSECSCLSHTLWMRYLLPVGIQKATRLRDTRGIAIPRACLLNKSARPFDSGR